MLTIVTPTLTAAGFIKNNIESVRQLNMDVEHIFVDGGSTDGTVDIIEKTLDGNRKLIHQDGDQGMYQALQMGFAEGKGEYFAYVNADDKVIKEGFQKMYREIRKGDFDLVYSDAYYYWSKKDKHEKIKGKRFGKYHLRNGYMPFVQSSSLYRRDMFEKVGGFRFDKFNIAGDLDLFQRMALQDHFKAGYLPVPSSIFLKHGNSLGDKNTDTYYEELKQLKRWNRNPINSLLFKISGLI